tara:strand:- start:427 stop:537 length:111 start_codon:yes stop_codon:yes gene_type:complete
VVLGFLALWMLWTVFIRVAVVGIIAAPVWKLAWGAF